MVVDPVDVDVASEPVVVVSLAASVESGAFVDDSEREFRTSDINRSNHGLSLSEGYA